MLNIVVHITYTLDNGVYRKAILSDERVRSGRLKLFPEFICEEDLMMIFCWASSSLVLHRHGWSVLFYPHPAGALDRLRSFLE